MDVTLVNMLVACTQCDKRVTTHDLLISSNWSQVLRVQSAQGAAVSDDVPAALFRPAPYTSGSPLDPSLLSQHLATNELQSPKVSSVG